MAYSSYWSYPKRSNRKRNHSPKKSSYLSHGWSYGQSAAEWGYNHCRSWNRGYGRRWNNNSRNRRTVRKYKWEKQRKTNPRFGRFHLNLNEKNNENDTSENIDCLAKEKAETKTNDEEKEKEKEKASLSNNKSTISGIFSFQSRAPRLTHSPKYLRCEQCDTYDKIEKLIVRNCERVCLDCYEKHRCDVCERLKKIEDVTVRSNGDSLWVCDYCNKNTEIDYGMEESDNQTRNDTRSCDSRHTYHSNYWGYEYHPTDYSDNSDSQEDDSDDDYYNVNHDSNNCNNIDNVYDHTDESIGNNIYSDGSNNGLDDSCESQAQNQETVECSDSDSDNNHYSYFW